MHDRPLCGRQREREGERDIIYISRNHSHTLKALELQCQHNMIDIRMYGALFKYYMYARISRVVYSNCVSANISP